MLGRIGSFARTVLFLPQVVPLVAAGIAWSWVLSTQGAVNQGLSAVGLGSVTRAWLGDFSFALPAVGLIGVWVLLGFCTVLLLVGMSKIDPSLYEASQLDGAGAIREFFDITLPSLRQEIGVCVTVTVVAALSAFDIVYISTSGGPGDATMVPGLEIYQLAFYNREVGLASALAVVLMLLVLICVIPVQWFVNRGAPVVNVCRTRRLSGATLLLLLIGLDAVAVSQPLHRGPPCLGNVSERSRLALPPALGQLHPGLPRREHGHDLQVERPDRGSARSLPPSIIATMAGFALGQLRVVGGRFIFLLFLLGLTLPFEGIIVPLYYEILRMGFLDTRWAIILPLTGLFMPFGVFWMRAHFVNMPDELTEAARIDGATTWQLFWGVHVPLARPAIVSLAILTTVWTWNQFLLAIVLVNNPLEADDGRSPRRVPGRLGDRHPASLGRLAADPRADDHHLLRLPAPVHLRPAPGIAQGLERGGIPPTSAVDGHPGASRMTLRLPDKWVWDFWTIKERDRAPHLLPAGTARAWIAAAASPSRVDRPRRLTTISAPWRVLPDALHPGPDGSWDDLATWTGSALEHEGRWYMLYTGISRREEGLIQRIGLAVSDDLLTWVKHPGNPVLEADPRWYDLLDRPRWRDQSWRDPWLFRHPHDGSFHCLDHGQVSARCAPTPPVSSVTRAHSTFSSGKCCRR